MANIRDQVINLTSPYGDSNASSPVTADDIRDLLAGGGLTNTELAAGIDAAKIGAGSVGNTEFGYLDGVSSAIQSQLNGKAASSHTHTLSQISDYPSAVSATELGYLDGVSSAIQSQLNGKAPIAHSHLPTGISANWGSWQAGSSGTVSLALNTYVALDFTVARRANASIHSTATNTSQFTAPLAGTYFVRGAAHMHPPASGDRSGYLGLTVNNAAPSSLGDLVIRTGVADPSRQYGQLQFADLLPLAQGDVVRIYAISNQGTAAVASAETIFTMALIGGL